jgi:DsbC/DsbD-like thiol-disulfide interchange protein
VSAWTEAELAREETSSVQEQGTSQAEGVLQRRLEPGQVVHWRDQP